MSKPERYPFAVARFEGERFRTRGLDVDVLPEIIAFKTAVLETAKVIWRVAHPGRERLDANFGGHFRLRVSGLQSGSVIVPLEREYEVKEDSSLALREGDEFERAAALTLEAIRAVSEDDLLPSDLPRSVLPYFEPLGSTLRPDEQIRIMMPGTEKGAIILPATGSRFRSRMVEEYTDTVTIEGEVRSANLDRRTFTIRLRDDTKVSGKYHQAIQQDPNIRLVEQSRQLFERSLERYGSRLDKAWSLTDCASFLIMEDQQIVAALAHDQHFEQAGFQALLR
jgi:hypothetical protein